MLVSSGLIHNIRIAIHREIFSKLYQIKPNSHCMNHFLIDVEVNERPFVPNQSENGKYNRISVWLNKIW